jgi:hypothetical protein
LSCSAWERSAPIANAKKSTIAIHIESRGTGARAAVRVVIAFHFLGTSDPGKSTAFRKSSVGGDKFSLGPSSPKNSEPIGSWGLSAALSAKPCCRSENSMITYATGVGSVTAQWYTRLRYAQQPVSIVTYQHQEQSLWMPIS